MNITDKIFSQLINNEALKQMPHFYELATTFSNYIETKDPNMIACSLYVPYKRTFEMVLNTEKIGKNLVPIIIHEILHIILGHFSREKVLEYRNRHKDITNIILDFHINESLNREYKGFFGDLPAVTIDTIMEFVRIAKEKNKPYTIPNLDNIFNPIEYWLEELRWIYNLGIPEEKDIHKYANFVSEGEELENSIEGLLCSLKSRPSDNSILERTLRELQTVKVTLNIPLIKRSMKKSIKVSDYTTYTKPNMHSIAYGYRKKQTIPEDLPKVILGIDISGSVSEEDHTKALSIALGLSAQVDVIYWSCSNVYMEDTIRNLDRKKIKNKIPKSNGGTDISTLFSVLENEGNHVLIVVTDMEFRDYIPAKTTKNLKFLSLEKVTSKEQRLKFYNNYIKTEIIEVK